MVQGFGRMGFVNRHRECLRPGLLLLLFTDPVCNYTAQARSSMPALPSYFEIAPEPRGLVIFNKGAMRSMNCLYMWVIHSWSQATGKPTH